MGVQNSQSRRVAHPWRLKAKKPSQALVIARSRSRRTARASVRPGRDPIDAIAPMARQKGLRIVAIVALILRDNILTILVAYEGVARGKR